MGEEIQTECWMCKFNSGINMKGTTNQNEILFRA